MNNKIFEDSEEDMIIEENTIQSDFNEHVITEDEKEKRRENVPKERRIVIRAKNKNSKKKDKFHPFIGFQEKTFYNELERIDDLDNIEVYSFLNIKKDEKTEKSNEEESIESITKDFSLISFRKNK